MKVFCCPQPVYITNSSVKMAQANTLVLPLIQPSWAATVERTLQAQRAAQTAQADPQRPLQAAAVWEEGGRYLKPETVCSLAYQSCVSLQEWE